MVMRHACQWAPGRSRLNCAPKRSRKWSTLFSKSSTIALMWFMCRQSRVLGMDQPPQRIVGVACSNSRDSRCHAGYRPQILECRWADNSRTIGSGALLQGDLPRRALALVKEWVGLHRGELEENWALAQAEEPLVAIARPP